MANFFYQAVPELSFHQLLSFGYQMSANAERKDLLWKRPDAASMHKADFIILKNGTGRGHFSLQSLGKDVNLFEETMDYADNVVNVEYHRGKMRLSVGPASLQHFVSLRLSELTTGYLAMISGEMPNGCEGAVQVLRELPMRVCYQHFDGSFVDENKTVCEYTAKESEQARALMIDIHANTSVNARVRFHAISALSFRFGVALPSAAIDEMREQVKQESATREADYRAQLELEMKVKIEEFRVKQETEAEAQRLMKQELAVKVEHHDLTHRDFDDESYEIMSTASGSQGKGVSKAPPKASYRALYREG